MFIKMLKCMMFAMVCNVALTPWGTSMAKVAGYATIICTVLAAFVGLKGKLRIQLNKGAIAIIVLFVVMCFGLLVDFRKLTFNFDLIKNIICIFCFYSLINIPQQKYSAKDLTHIFRINKILALVYIAYTFLPLSFRYSVVNRWGDTSFTMNMGNTNATSVLVMFCVALLCMEFKRETRIGYKVVNAAIVLALMYTLIKLQSRTVVACTILIIACVWIRKMNFKQWYGTIVILLPIIYFVLQIILRELEGIVVLGKALNTGRGEMFVEQLQQILAAPGKYILGSVVTHNFANAHNAPIAIVANFGYIGLLTYLIFWKYQLKMLIDDTDRTALQAIALVVLFTFIIHSSTEASPMLGGIPYASAVILIIRLAKDRFEEETVDEQLDDIRGLKIVWSKKK